MRAKEQEKYSPFPLTTMSIRTLEGLGSTSAVPAMYLPAPVVGIDEFDGMLADRVLASSGLGSSSTITNEAIARDGIGRMKNMLINTMGILAAKKNRTKDEEIVLKGLQPLLNVWDNELQREAALVRLSGIEGVIDGMNGLGDAGLGGLFSNIKNAIQNIKENISESAPKLAETVHKVTHTVKKYVPVTAGPRIGMLIAFKTNLFQLSAKAGFGLISRSEAMKYGLSATDHAKLQKRANDTIEQFYKLGGERDVMKKAITTAWARAKAKGKLARITNKDAGQLEGLPQEGLGVAPAVGTAGAVATAMPLLTKIMSWLNEIDWKKVEKVTQTAGKVVNTAQQVVDYGIQNFGGGTQTGDKVQQDKADGKAPMYPPNTTTSAPLAPTVPPADQSQNNGENGGGGGGGKAAMGVAAAVALLTAFM